MKLGRISLLLVLITFFNYKLFADDKITTVPLVNLEELEPSYEEVETESTENSNYKNIKIKEKRKKTSSEKNTIINILGLDKITAKTTKINIKLGETKKFGLLEIKAIKCGKIDAVEEKGEAACIQVKDLSDNQDEKVFVFNGWTFSSSPSLRPIDHPVYDIWLVSCENV